MKNALGGSLVLGLALLTGCTMQGPVNLAVHEALFYGGNQQRFAWVYGSLSGGSVSTVKLNDAVVTLRPQVSGDVLAVPGTLSVDGKAAYVGKTSPTTARVNVTRSGTRYSIQALSNVDAVYATDGSAWYRLSGPVSAGQTVLSTPTASVALRGAGALTDAEADALGSELKGQGALAVAVLPAGSLPDQALKVEPAPTAGGTLTGLYVQGGVPQAAETPFQSPSTVTVPPAGASAARQIAAGNNAAAQSFAVVVARTPAGVSSLWATAYGRQTSAPAVPTLAAGRSLVGVFLGQRPTGGYSVSLASARIVGGVLQLNVNVNTPGAGSITTQALTSPWLAAEVSGAFSSVVVRDAAGNVLN